MFLVTKNEWDNGQLFNFYTCSDIPETFTFAVFSVTLFGQAYPFPALLEFAVFRNRLNFRSLYM